MRLYRAMSMNEKILNSHKRVFSKGKNAISNICVLNEIYSQIIPTHNLNKASQNRIIFSFTDDIDVACRFIEKYPTTYNKIGYIDVEISDETSALLINNENILFIKPIFRLLDWIDLATYNVSENKNYCTSITVNNVNYARKEFPLINTLVPSRWGALSLARTAREYVVICQNLFPTILSKKDINYERKNKHLENFNLFLSDNDSTTKKEVIKSLKNDLENVDISQVRKDYLFKMLSECI
ncbi:hypothetical protein AB2T19_000807 [Clostridium botulinum]